MDRKIKIAHIGQFLGGVNTYIKLLAAYLDESKFELIIISDSESNSQPITYRSGKSVKNFTVSLEREIKLVKDLRLVYQAFKLVRSEMPDLIHCHSAKGGIVGRTIGKLLNIPTFYTPHAFSYLSTTSSLKKIVFKSLEKLYSYTNSYLIACSESEAFRGIHEVNYDPERVYVINNSLPKPSADPEFKDNSFYICSIGRPSYQKNTLQLLSIFKEINNSFPEIELYILGVGHYSPDLDAAEEFIDNNHLQHRVKLLPWTTRQETLEILKDSLFYISLSRYEGLPYAVLEAMCLGKACALSDVDGNRDCITDNISGLLIDLRSPVKESAKRIMELLKDRSKLDDFGKKAYQQFNDNFTIDKSIIKLEQLYCKYVK